MKKIIVLMLITLCVGDLRSAESVAVSSKWISLVQSVLKHGSVQGVPGENRVVAIVMEHTVQQSKTTSEIDRILVMGPNPSLTNGHFIPLLVGVEQEHWNLGKYQNKTAWVIDQYMISSDSNEILQEISHHKIYLNLQKQILEDSVVSKHSVSSTTPTTSEEQARWNSLITFWTELLVAK